SPIHETTRVCVLSTLHRRLLSDSQRFVFFLLPQSNGGLRFIADLGHGMAESNRPLCHGEGSYYLSLLWPKQF
ncbi:hypothetical protein SK128_011791, partial [Halocaridina rubra]